MVAVLALLKCAAVLLVGAGVVQGYGDGDEFDEAGCTVAQQPGGASHREHSHGSQDGGGGNAPESGGAGAGGAGGGGPGSQAECEAQPVSRAGDEFRWLAGLPAVQNMWAGLQREVAALREGFGELRSAKQRLEKMFAEFGRQVENGNGFARMMQQINSKLDAIAIGASELRRENKELKEMQGAGLFKFALRVDGEDFQAFAAVMGLGNRKAAAEFLRVPLRSFYERVDGWKTRGRDYQRMFRLVEWRKATGRKIRVRLEDSLQSGDGSDAENPETLGDVLAKMREQGPDDMAYDDILRQVWQALQEQNADNWDAVRRELVDILREELPQ
jgi:hypothetical protein